MTVIVTGAAGFVGAHVAERLLQRGERVIGVDEFNAYYDVSLKDLRAERLSAHPSFRMVRADIADAEAMMELVRSSGARRVVHLAAQAGVRYSIENPFAYQRSNLQGHLSILEACRHNGVEHLVYASSSSVYGNRPLEGEGFREDDPTVTPVSLYAATKCSCELISPGYASLYGSPSQPDDKRFPKFRTGARRRIWWFSQIGRKVDARSSTRHLPPPPEAPGDPAIGWRRSR